MLELTGFDSVLRGIGFLYWALAIGAVVLAIRYGKGTRGKALGVAVAVAAFGYLPTKLLIENHQRNTYAKAAWAYFKHKCDTEAGEKIYKTFMGVKSLLIVKPLPPATEKDLFDQFWYGDPYSNATPVSDRGESAALRLASRTAPLAEGKNGPGFDLVEMQTDSLGSIKKYYYPEGARDHATSINSERFSRFGISWEDISTPDGRKYWVASSRLRVIDLSDNSVVAERIGYLIESGFGSAAGQRVPWLTARGIGPNGRSCPATHDWSDRWFLLKVLNPSEEKQDGK